MLRARRQLPAALIFALCSLPILGLGVVAAAHAQTQAQPRPAAAPVIEGLEVNADSGLSPGSTLEFTVKGTPNSIARVQVTGTSVSLPLKESKPGVYTGNYTVRKNERGLKSSSVIRADLTRNGRTVNSNFSFPASFGMLAANSVTPASAPRVDRFTLAPVDRLEPGTELRFSLEGTPRAQASIQVPGLPMTLPMHEERPGRYIANYTLRRVDNVAPGPVVATLRNGERLATSQLSIAQQGQPSASTSASASASATSTPMGASGSAVAAPGPLVLQVTSPGPNAAIDSSQMVLQGRTSPGANVRVKVDAVSPATPGRTAVAQAVSDQTVTADANGNFSANFGPQRYAPGTRFEVQLSARQGNQAAVEQRLVLFQRQG